LRALDRLYLENNSFEHSDSFASVFFGLLDPSRRLFHYASAAHEPVIVVAPGEEPRVLATTAPLIGVFDDQHHLFRQGFINLEPGSLLVATTDGVTECRNRSGEQFGMQRLLSVVDRCRDLPEADILNEILAATEEHCPEPRRDDIALIALRVCV
jgi:sigma-B regulation protein RsbU (phosphoserine phosphatase)